MSCAIAKYILVFFCLSLSACCSSPGYSVKEVDHLGKYDIAREERIKEIEETMWMQPPEIRSVLQTELDYLKRQRYESDSQSVQDFFFGD